MWTFQEPPPSFMKNDFSQEHMNIAIVFFYTITKLRLFFHLQLHKIKIVLLSTIFFTSFHRDWALSYWVFGFSEGFAFLNAWIKSSYFPILSEKLNKIQVSWKLSRKIQKKTSFCLQNKSIWYSIFIKESNIFKNATYKIVIVVKFTIKKNSIVS